MSGLRSRRKGYRGEYMVRDYFRLLGYEADRVPSSGAAEGFKGDVKVRQPQTGTTFLVEVKSRQNSFKSIYEFLESHRKGFNSPVAYVNLDNALVALGYNFTDVSVLEGAFFQTRAKTRTISKIFNLQKLVKECDYLVIKDNNRPLIFLRFL